MRPPLRVAIVDVGRTVAIVAMAIFHFTYDLEMFGFAPRGTMASREWVLFAQAIAGSFIFLSGVSLVLATVNGPIAPRKYLRRLGLLALAAAAVSAGTYAAMGPAFVRFGILHLMFAASVLGLVFLASPFWITGVVGVVILGAPHVLDWPLFDSTNWLWLSITKTRIPPMVDYAPILPWFGAFLLGMSTAQFTSWSGKWHSIASLLNPDNRIVRAVSWPGKHSLMIYLIHQPILISCVALTRFLLN